MLNGQREVKARIRTKCTPFYSFSFSSSRSCYFKEKPKHATAFPCSLSPFPPPINNRTITLPSVSSTLFPKNKTITHQDQTKTSVALPASKRQLLRNQASPSNRTLNWRTWRRQTPQWQTPRPPPRSKNITTLPPPPRASVDPPRRPLSGDRPNPPLSPVRLLPPPVAAQGPGFWRPLP